MLQDIKQIKNEGLKILIIFLINFGIFFSYYFFVPGVFLALFIWYAKSEKTKIFSKKIIIFVTITILIPTICGIQFIFKPKKDEIQQSQMLVEYTHDFKEEKDVAGVNVNALKVQAQDEGYIYRNLISNFVPFIPLIILAIYTEVKHKEISYVSILFMSLLIYMIATFCLVKLDFLSTYAFFKIHYLLWPISIILTYEAINILINSRKQISKIYDCSNRNSICSNNYIFIIKNRNKRIG